MEEDKKIEIHYGALSDNLLVQLDNQGYKYNKEKINTLDKLRYSANMLYLHSYISDKEYDKIINKIQKEIVKEVRKNNE